MFNLTHKQLLELSYWLTCDRHDEAGKSLRYMDQFGLPELFPHDMVNFSQLEIGTGPGWGMLNYLYASTRYAVDPLFPAYEACGILAERDGIMRVDEPFEAWDTNLTFDAILTANALDHGEMGFHLLPKIWAMLKPGGRFYCHVHLRPPDLINLVHDHGLTEAQLDKHLSYTTLIEERRVILPHDVDGWECPTLVGVWRKPE